MKLKQQIHDGPRPPAHTHTHTHTQRRRACGAAPPPAPPLCADDDWARRCPSGCRLQGLTWQAARRAERRLRTLCETAAMQQDAVESSMSTMTHVYSAERRLMVSRHVSQLKFVERAAGLAGNLTSLRKQSSRLSLRLGELQSAIRTQMEELQRTEVDVDMALRSCSGSCRSASPFSVDHLGYQTLGADLERLERRKKAPPPQRVAHIRLQPAQVGPAPPAAYRTIPAVQRELLTQFEDIEQNQVILEELLD